MQFLATSCCSTTVLHTAGPDPSSLLCLFASSCGCNFKILTQAEGKVGAFTNILHDVYMFDAAIAFNNTYYYYYINPPTNGAYTNRGGVHTMLIIRDARRMDVLPALLLMMHDVHHACMYYVLCNAPNQKDLLTANMSTTSIIPNC